MRKTVSGFTVVELLIVIVVIAILAAISIVAYSGMQDRARSSSSQGAVKLVANKVATYMAEHDNCPANLAALNIQSTSDVTYQYSCNNSIVPSVYCVTADVGGQLYYIDSATRTSPTAGVCSNYNFLLWNKPSGTPPVSGVSVDTSIYRTSAGSLRFAPGQVGYSVYNSPYGGQQGQTYTLSLWIRTDSSWNGTANNSKIRFGSVINGAPLHVCGYQGVKTNWTLVACSYTLTSVERSVHISVGNDGTAGNIWLDDFTLTRSY